MDASPVVVNRKMSFFNALKEVLMGGKITRLSWPKPGVYIFLLNDRLTIVSEEGVSDLIISKGDLEGEEDWVKL